LAPVATAASPTTLTASLIGSGIKTLNPFLGFLKDETNTMGMIYPSLTALDVQGKPQPYLASSWTTSADGLIWTFTIANGLKWSDGQPITAKDAAWTLNLIMTNKAAQAANGSLVSNFTSVSAPDDSTLIVTTKKPQSNMLYVSVPVAGISIVPEHVWTNHVADVGTYDNMSFPVVGYGPWVLTDYKTDQYEKFSANKDFMLGNQGAPAFDNLILNYYADTDTAVAALKSNAIDFVTSLTTTQFESLKNVSGIQTVQEASNRWNGIELNSGAKSASGKVLGTGNPILADPQVRLAMHYAIDTNKLVTTVLGGLGLPGVGYLPPAWTQWVWTPSSADAVSYDPDKANSILDAAGYTKGSDGIRVDPKTGKKLSFRLGIHSSTARDAPVSQYLAGWWKAIGIDTQVQAMASTQLNDNLAKGDFDILMDSWSTGPDPSYLLSIQTCAGLPDDQAKDGYTDSFFCDPAYDTLYDQQLTTLDATARAGVMGQMQDILYKANNDIIMYYGDILDAVRTDAVSNLITGSADANGLYPPQSVFWTYLSATPPNSPATGASGASAAGNSSASSSSSSNATVWIVLLIVVVVIAGGGLLVVRRRSAAGERE
jgi:peptide/nickel transport system substrate-binding protein